jgi:hypothetical protein
VIIVLTQFYFMIIVSARRGQLTNVQASADGRSWMVDMSAQRSD